MMLILAARLYIFIQHIARQMPEGASRALQIHDVHDNLF